MIKKIINYFKLLVRQDIKYSNGIVSVDYFAAEERARKAKKEIQSKWQEWTEISKHN